VELHHLTQPAAALKHLFRVGPYSQEPPTLVEFRLEPAAGGTRLTVVESGFDALPPHRRADARRSNEGGWEEPMRNIRAHAES
jgi:hypothetical protein